MRHLPYILPVFGAFATTIEIIAGLAAVAGAVGGAAYVYFAQPKQRKVVLRSSLEPVKDSTSSG